MFDELRVLAVLAGPRDHSRRLGKKVVVQRPPAHVEVGFLVPRLRLYHVLVRCRRRVHFFFVDA